MLSEQSDSFFIKKNIDFYDIFFKAEERICALRNVLGVLQRMVVIMMNSYVNSLSILNVLNKNYAAMHKSMLRLSTGQRINSAADDPSGWAIGTRMSIEIRALDQARRNAQSSQSMLKVADGAVSSTVDIIRTLKEKALAAANGTMTDADAVMCKRNLTSLSTR